MNNDITMSPAPAWGRRALDVALIVLGLAALALLAAVGLGLVQWSQWMAAFGPLGIGLLGLRWVIWPEASQLFDQRDARLFGAILLALMSFVLIISIFQFVTE